MKDSTYNKYCLIIDEWFINGRNGTKAYKKFNPNSTDASADTSFRDILDIPRMQEYKKSKENKASEKLEITHDEILKYLKNWAESDITETIGLTPEEVKELPLHIRQLVTKYKHTVRWVSGLTPDAPPEKEEVIELHFVSKEKALEMINKHTGFYEADNRQKQAQIDYSKLSDDVIKQISDASN